MRHCECQKCRKSMPLNETFAIDNYKCLCRDCSQELIKKLDKAFFSMQYFNVSEPVSMFLMWLGLSIGMHAFPSTQDARILFQHAKKEVKSRNPLAIVSFPLVLLIFAANILSFFWFDLIYGVALGIGLPSLIF